MFALLLLPFLAYLGLLYWFISRRYIPHSMVAIKPVDPDNNPYKLARSAFTILHIIHSLLFFLLIIWTPVSVLMLLPLDHGTSIENTISIFANLNVNLSELSDIEVSGLKEQFIQAKTEVELQAPNLVTHMIFIVTKLIKGFLFLFVVLQLRNILASLCNGDSFTAGNSQRLNWAGKVVVFSYLAGPIWNLFLSISVIKTIDFSTTAITMTPATDASFIGLFVGVGLLILSGVIKEAERLQAEQRLTI